VCRHGHHGLFGCRPPHYLTFRAIHMASGLFIGLTEDELLAIKTKAVALITAGVTLTSYADSGTSVSKAVSMPPKEMLAEAMFALSKLDNTVYGSRKSVVNTNWNNSII